ncbi:hypothetical protein MOUN0_O00320 [Monosporozyma unispora]
MFFFDIKKKMNLQVKFDKKRHRVYSLRNNSSYIK